MKPLIAFVLLAALAGPARAGSAWIGLVLDRGTGGVKVRQVMDGSPGQRAGIHPGETVTHIDDTPTPAPEQFIAVVVKNRVGATLKLKVSGTDGAVRTVPVTLEARPHEDELQKRSLVGREAP